MGVAGDDRLALGGDGDQFLAGEPRSYSSFSPTAAAAALAAEEPSPDAGRTPLSMRMRAGASSASATAPTTFRSGSVGMYWLPTPVTSIVVRSARST